MKLLIDDARPDLIKEIRQYYPIDGVTTNPTILAKSGRPPYEVLKEIRALIGADADLHVQVIAGTVEGMVKDARRIQAELGKNTLIKIPSVPVGFSAMQILKAEGARVTATAVYTPMQAYLAAKSGADYVAPYINRIDNMGFDGIRVAKEIQDIFGNNGYKTQILAASFKNSQQVLELCKYGIGAATVSPEVIKAFVNNAAVDSAVEAFVKDFETLCGEGRTMADL